MNTLQLYIDEYKARGLNAPYGFSNDDPEAMKIAKLDDGLRKKGLM